MKVSCWILGFPLTLSKLVPVLNLLIHAVTCRPSAPATRSTEWLRRAGPRNQRRQAWRTGSARCRTARSITSSDSFRRTSILAQRWRNLWRSMRRLRLTDLDRDKQRGPAFRNFIDGLLLLRNNSVALDEVELTV